MHATEYLHDKIDVAKLMEHYKFDHMRAEGDLIRSACAIHGGDNASGFVMRVSNGLWFCHTGTCGGGDIYKLVMRMEECTFKESVQFVADFFSIDIGEHEIINVNAKEEKELKAWVSAITSRRLHAPAPYNPEGDMRKVTKFRSYTPDTLDHFGLYHAITVDALKQDGSKYTLRDRLAFPIRIEGIQVGMSYRRRKSTDFPKWLHQPTSIQTRNLLYNYDATSGQDEIVVVEGITDVWAYHELGVCAVATYGAHLSDEQFKMLIRTGADIVLSYDGDEAGQEATKKVYERLQYVANVKYVPFNAGEDPDNLDRKELWTRYENRCRID